MKKITIEIEVGDDIFYDHAQQSIIDALWWAENVTQAEHDLIQQVLNKLQDADKNHTHQSL
ncbi:MAG: hypothetical protein ACK5DE_14040 [Bacteroidota bacterium]|jgi:hypothetical protein